MNIAIIVDNIERCNFFIRVASALQAEINANVKFYTHRFTCFRFLTKQGFTAKLFGRKASGTQQKYLENFQPLELLRNDLNEEQTHDIARATISFLNEEFSKAKPDVAFIWNGQQLIESCVAAYSRDNGIRTIFWEIGNFPGKMVADPKGVNIQGISKKYISDIRSSVPINESEFKAWAEKTIEEKKKSGARQVKTAKQIPAERVIDLIASYFGKGFRTISLPAATKRLTNKALNKQTLNKLSHNQNLTFNFNSPYIFFPLQVSTDTQILLNSETSMETAVEKAAAQTKDQTSLVLKFHPAEINITFIDNIVEMVRASDNVFLSFDDTYKLISDSKKVYVINSTVGYEALLMGKEVEFFSDTHYPRSKDDLQSLYSYYHYYLVDAEYFTDTPITKHLVTQLLERINDENHV